MEVVELAALAVDADAERILGVIELGVRPEGATDAGNEEEKALIVPVLEHGHGLELFGIDLAAGVGAVGLEERGGGGADVNGLRDGSGGEFKVDAGGGIGQQFDAGSQGFTEAGFFGFDAVGARIETDEEEVTGVVGLGGTARVRLGFDDGNFDAGDNGT